MRITICCMHQLWVELDISVSNASRALWWHQGNRAQHGEKELSSCCTALGNHLYVELKITFDLSFPGNLITVPSHPIVLCSQDATHNSEKDGKQFLRDQLHI